MCWRSSPDRERPMVRLKRSTAGLNICAGLLWGSVTSPTTSPGVCSSPVASDRFYTLNYDEPNLTALGSCDGCNCGEDSSTFCCVNGKSEGPLIATLNLGSPKTPGCRTSR